MVAYIRGRRGDRDAVTAQQQGEIIDARLARHAAAG